MHILEIYVHDGIPASWQLHLFFDQLQISRLTFDFVSTNKG